MTTVTFVSRNPQSNINPHMTLDSLLLSRDQQVISVLRPALEKLSVDVEVCRGVRSGNEILCNEKFDAIVIDCDDLQGGLDVLKNVSKSTSNRNSVTFALLNGKTTTIQAFEMGAKFVLQKPISPLNASRCFSAALGFMVNEQRRYFRHPVDMPVVLIFNQGQEVKANTTNLSDGGMAIRFSGAMPKGSISRVCFTLPDGDICMEPKGEFAWMDDKDRAGIRFVDFPKTSREKLERWLAEQLIKPIEAEQEQP
jgi:ActR/RegA family two-component response regulator